jgi:hypothetical protein
MWRGRGRGRHGLGLGLALTVAMMDMKKVVEKAGDARILVI